MLKIFDVSARYFIFNCVVSKASLACSCLLFFLEYQHQTHTQFKVFRDQVKAWDEEIVVMKAGIKPMHDCIGFEPPKGREVLPRDPPPRSVLHQCCTAWSDLKEFARSATHEVVVHVLAQLRSHYPVVDL